jgi:hypothetical protein
MISLPRSQTRSAAMSASGSFHIFSRKRIVKRW